MTLLEIPENFVNFLIAVENRNTNFTRISINTDNLIT